MPNKTLPRFVTLRESGFFKDSRRPNILIDNEETVFVSEGSYPVFGDGVRLGPNVFLIGDVQIGPRSIILPGSWIVNSRIGLDASIGPTAYLEDCDIGPGAKIGFTAQFKRANIGKNFTAKHHCYGGDLSAYDNINMGAGVIIANYDGIKKHPTLIGDNVFIGTNVNLIPPIMIDKETYIAAGTTLDGRKLNDKKIPPYSFVVARPELHIGENTFARRTNQGYEIVKIRKNVRALLEEAFEYNGMDKGDLRLKIYNWLTQPHKVLDNRLPLDLIIEEKEDVVRKVLLEMLSGVFSV